MPRLRSFGNSAIYVYAMPAEHPPTHFHIVGPDLDVSIRLDTLEVLEGQFRWKDIAEAMDWAKANAAVLQEAWELYNDRG